MVVVESTVSQYVEGNPSLRCTIFTLTPFIPGVSLRLPRVGPLAAVPLTAGAESVTLLSRPTRRDGPPRPLRPSTTTPHRMAQHHRRERRHLPGTVTGNKENACGSVVELTRERPGAVRAIGAIALAVLVATAPGSTAGAVSVADTPDPATQFAKAGSNVSSREMT